MNNFAEIYTLHIDSINIIKIDKFKIQAVYNNLNLDFAKIFY